MGKKLQYSFRGGKTFFLYPFMFLTGTPVIRDRLTREKRTNLFNISFTWHGSLRKEMKTQRNNETWVFLC